MPQGRTKRANASSHTKSYQGTWVYKWHPPEHVFEDGHEQVYDDDRPYDSHNELWHGPRPKEA